MSAAGGASPTRDASESSYESMCESLSMNAALLARFVDDLKTADDAMLPRFFKKIATHSNWVNKYAEILKTLPPPLGNVPKTSEEKEEEEASQDIAIELAYEEAVAADVQDPVVQDPFIVMKKSPIEMFTAFQKRVKDLVMAKENVDLNSPALKKKWGILVNVPAAFAKHVKDSSIGYEVTDEEIVSIFNSWGGRSAEDIAEAAAKKLAKKAKEVAMMAKSAVASAAKNA